MTGVSTGPPAGPTGHRWSLRVRLLATQLGLLAAIALIIGVITTAALHAFLLDRLDDQLAAARARATGGAAGDPDQSYNNPLEPRPRPTPRFLLLPGQGEGTLGALVVDQQVAAAAVLDAHGTALPIPSVEEPVLVGVPVDGDPHSRNLGALGDYRLIAVRMPDYSVVITGLPLNGVNTTVFRLIAVELVVAAAGLTVAGLAGAGLLRLNLRPLQRVASTAARVAELPLDRGEVALAERVPVEDTDPRTEVGQVGAALNRLLDHVGAALTARQASETRVRQFVADAGHELRTPLASIRGYSELARRSKEPVPTDIAHALRRVESEASRMTALVEDLLLLARLDAGRSLVAAPVDLSRLVIDVVSDARVAGPDHEWRIDLPAEAVTVVGDEARLHQVLANLLSNARVHTPPGTSVTTTLRVERPHVLLIVTDNGPGIPAELLPRVFGRFARGDSSRSRAAGSTGLGLAIVAAVTEAHHGSVQVSSEPGRTSFVVRLPSVVMPASPTEQPASSEKDVTATPQEGDTPTTAHPSSLQA